MAACEPYIYLSRETFNAFYEGAVNGTLGRLCTVLNREDLKVLLSEGFEVNELEDNMIIARWDKSTRGMGRILHDVSILFHCRSIQDGLKTNHRVLHPIEYPIEIDDSDFCKEICDIISTHSINCSYSKPDDKGTIIQAINKEMQDKQQR
jgi:hypothetical protein